MSQQANATTLLRANALHAERREAMFTALLAATGLFAGLALLAAIPLVLLLHVTQRHQDRKG